MELWRQVTRALALVLNSLLPVSLVPEGLASSRPTHVAAVGFDRWAHVHFG